MMTPLKQILLPLLTLLLATVHTQAQVMKQRTATLMGSRFDFTVVAPDDSVAGFYIDTCIAEIKRIENVISEWLPGTLVSEINRNAGIRPVKVTKELFDLTDRALRFSALTGGAFDISIAAMDRIWRFDGSMQHLPDKPAIQKAIEKVGYRNIILNAADTTIFLRLSGMKIGFGSIGKGYAADKGKALLQQLGVKAGIVNASGDLCTWGTQPDGTPWQIGLTDPFHPDRNLKILSMHTGAVTTSGSYQKFVRFNGRRYAHIINPVTGYPATGLISVTVTGPVAETCNGLSTSIMVLGLRNGLQLMRQFPGYKCIIVTEKGQVVYHPKHHTGF